MQSKQKHIEMVIEARQRDLGGFAVRRVLPWMRRRMVGPFIFFDEMGPQTMGAGEGIDVRPHPHIGLSTVTYLFAGELLHRDSLGSVQRIKPGEVNWMTAGRGIVHSERTPAELRKTGHHVFGIQVWVAHPLAEEETEPAFAHYAADAIPEIQAAGVCLRLIAGAMMGQTSPVKTFSPMFYAEALFEPGAAFTLPADYAERAVFVAEGGIQLADGETAYAPGQMLVFHPGEPITMHATASEKTRLMLLGGEPLDGERYIYWNFVSSSKERIEKAKADWREKRFPQVPGETEFIPLPKSGPADVKYP